MDHICKIQLLRGRSFLISIRWVVVRERNFRMSSSQMFPERACCGRLAIVSFLLFAHFANECIVFFGIVTPYFLLSFPEIFGCGLICFCVSSWHWTIGISDMDEIEYNGIALWLRSNGRVRSRRVLLRIHRRSDRNKMRRRSVNVISYGDSRVHTREWNEIFVPIISMVCGWRLRMADGVPIGCCCFQILLARFDDSSRRCLFKMSWNILLCSKSHLIL